MRSAFAHNFAASTQGRYSVMDYPAPRVTPRERRSFAEGCLRLGLGPWDRWVDQVAVRRTDRRRSAADPGAKRARRDCASSPTMMRARSARASPKARLWDDGADPVGELRRMMEVRSVARCSGSEPAHSIAGRANSGRSAPRVRADLAARPLSGRGRGKVCRRRRFPVRDQRARRWRREPSPGSVQWAALYALLDTLTPAELTVPGATSCRCCRAGFGGNNDRQTDIEIIPDCRRTGVRSAQGHRSRRRANAQRLAGPRTPQSSRSSACGRCLGACARATVRPAARSHSRPVAAIDVGRRIATTTVLALARVQRDPALSPTIALQLSGRLDRLATELDRERGAQQDWARGLAALLKDREALDKAIADTARLPKRSTGHADRHGRGSLGRVSMNSSASLLISKPKGAWMATCSSPMRGPTSRMPNAWRMRCRKRL